MGAIGILSGCPRLILYNDMAESVTTHRYETVALYVLCWRYFRWTSVEDRRRAYVFDVNGTTYSSDGGIDLVEAESARR